MIHIFHVFICNPRQLLLFPPFIFRAMPSSRIRNKVYKYAVFFFLDGNKIGTAPTSNILEGYKTHIKQAETVSLNWEGSPVLGKIIFLHGKYWFLSMSTIRVTRSVKFTGCARKPKK